MAGEKKTHHGPRAWIQASATSVRVEHAHTRKTRPVRTYVKRPLSCQCLCQNERVTLSVSERWKIINLHIFIYLMLGHEYIRVGLRPPCLITYFTPFLIYWNSFFFNWTYFLSLFTFYLMFFFFVVFSILSRVIYLALFFLAWPSEKELLNSVLVSSVTSVWLFISRPGIVLAISSLDLYN